MTTATVAASPPITYTLPGFPLVNQLLDPPGDPYPDNNQRMNCVPASLSAGASYLLQRILYGSQLKDAVYGTGYQGPQAAASYVAYLAQQGVALTPYNNASGAQLVAHIHAAVAAGRPVVATIPSQWGIAPPDPLHYLGYSHVVVMCGSGPGALRAMNPWGGFWHDGSDSYWMARLCFGQVWDMARRGGQQAMAWTQQHDGSGLDAHGHTCGQGDMGYLAQHSLAGADGLMSEVFYTANDSFLPLANGRIVTAHHLGNGAWTVDEQGAQALISVWQSYQAALAARPANCDPTEHAKAAALDGLLALYGVK